MELTMSNELTRPFRIPRRKTNEGGGGSGAPATTGSPLVASGSKRLGPDDDFETSSPTKSQKRNEKADEQPQQQRHSRHQKHQNQQQKPPATSSQQYQNRRGGGAGGFGQDGSRQRSGGRTHQHHNQHGSGQQPGTSKAIGLNVSAASNVATEASNNDNSGGGPLAPGPSSSGPRPAAIIDSRDARGGEPKAGPSKHHRHAGDPKDPLTHGEKTPAFGLMDKIFGEMRTARLRDRRQSGSETSPQQGDEAKLTRALLARHTTDNASCYDFMAREGLMERILGHKMLHGKVDSHEKMGYVRMQPGDRPDYSLDLDDCLGGSAGLGSNAPPPPAPVMTQIGGTPAVTRPSPQGDHRSQQPRRGPKTPPGSPGPVTPPPPVPRPPHLSGVHDPNALIQSMMMATGSNVQLDDEMKKALTNMTPERLMETIRNALRGANKEEPVEFEPPAAKRIKSEEASYRSESVSMELASSLSCESPPPPPPESPILLAPPPPPALSMAMDPPVPQPPMPPMPSSLGIGGNLIPPAMLGMMPPPPPHPASAPPPFGLLGAPPPPFMQLAPHPGVLPPPGPPPGGPPPFGSSSLTGLSHPPPPGAPPMLAGGPGGLSSSSFGQLPPPPPPNMSMPPPGLQPPGSMNFSMPPPPATQHQMQHPPPPGQPPSSFAPPPPGRPSVVVNGQPPPIMGGVTVGGISTNPPPPPFSSAPSQPPPPVPKYTASGSLNTNMPPPNMQNLTPATSTPSKPPLFNLNVPPPMTQTSTTIEKPKLQVKIENIESPSMSHPPPPNFHGPPPGFPPTQGGTARFEDVKMPPRGRSDSLGTGNSTPARPPHQFGGPPPSGRNARFGQPRGSMQPPPQNVSSSLGAANSGPPPSAPPTSTPGFQHNVQATLFSALGLGFMGGGTSAPPPSGGNVPPQGPPPPSHRLVDRYGNPLPLPDRLRAGGGAGPAGPAPGSGPMVPPPTMDMQQQPQQMEFANAAPKSNPLNITAAAFKGRGRDW